MKRTFKRALSIMLSVILMLGTVAIGGEGFAEVLEAFSVKASATKITDYETGDIIEFGWYPQSKVTDTALISKLDSVSKSWVSYNYYSGTGVSNDGQMISSDYMKYADFTYGDTKYRAVTFNEYRPNLTGDEHTGRTYQDDNGYTTGETYYFKYEPIEWRVLDPSSGLIMCATAIDSQAYNNYIWYGVGSKSTSSEYYGDSAHTYYASDYANSSIRKWLNNDFYNTAFSSSQQSIIKTTTLDNSSTYSSTYDSATTNDKIYLLSYDDTVNSNYGFNSDYSAYDTARQLKSSDYAKCQGCYSSTSSSYLGNCWWLLRSPDGSGDARFIDDGGDGDYPIYVGDTLDGVVPALNLNLSSDIFQCDVSETGLTKPAPVYSIKNMSKYNNQTIDYKSSLTIYADVQNCTDVKWFVSGADYSVNSDGSVTINQATGTFSVYFTAKDLDGKEVKSETETVKVKSGFFDKLIAFFKGLFGSLPKLKQ